MTTNKNHNSPNVPNLRFPEFEGEWEKIKLKDVCTFYSGGTPSSSNKDYYTGDIPFIRSGELHESCTELFISKDGLNNSSAKIVHKGDLLLALYGATSGDIAISQIEGAINQAILCINTEQSKEYIKAVWQKHVQKILQTYLQGGQGNLSADIVKNISFYFALSKEQDKLANFIRLLDERIATQNKIIEKLQSLIKGLVDSLLENPSWEKVYLCSFMQFYSTNSLSWEQLSYSNGNVRNMHYGLIHGFQMSLIDSTLLPRILPNYLPKQYTVCQDGDVVFADASEDTNEIGKAIEFSNTINVKTVCGLHTIHGRDIKQNTILGFKGFAFNSRYFHDQVRRLAQGTKVYSITAKNLLSCFVYIPDVIKQENIVRRLNAYEENLSLNRTLLNKYEIQKQYLLQQMLI